MTSQYQMVSDFFLLKTTYRDCTVKRRNTEATGFQADTPVLDANVPSSTLVNDSQPSDVPPVDDLPLSGGDSSPTPTPTDVLPMATNSPGVLVQPPDIPDQSPHPSDPPPPPATTTPLQNPSPGSIPPASPDPPHSSTIKYDPRSAPPEPTQTDYFIPSSALK